MNELFESLDEKIFTADLKESLETSFNEAVELKVTELAEAKISELTEKSEAHIDELTEKAEEFAEIQKTEMLESIDGFLERVVEEFVQDHTEALAESVKNEKSDAIIESMDAMLTLTGMDIAKITEAKDASEDATKLAESIEKYDTLVTENIELGKENANLLKMGVISEAKEGLSIVESEKFEKLANLVEFTKDDAYAEKLDTIKESVKGAIEKKENLNETVKTKSAFAHLI